MGTSQHPATNPSEKQVIPDSSFQSSPRFSLCSLAAVHSGETLRTPSPHQSLPPAPRDSLGQEGTGQAAGTLACQRTSSAWSVAQRRSRVQELLASVLSGLGGGGGVNPRSDGGGDVPSPRRHLR